MFTSVFYFQNIEYKCMIKIFCINNYFQKKVEFVLFLLLQATQLVE